MFSSTTSPSSSPVVVLLLTIVVMFPAITIMVLMLSSELRKRTQNSKSTSVSKNGIDDTVAVDGRKKRNETEIDNHETILPSSVQNTDGNNYHKISGSLFQKLMIISVAITVFVSFIITVVIVPEQKESVHVFVKQSIDTIMNNMNRKKSDFKNNDTDTVKSNEIIGDNEAPSLSPTDITDEEKGAILANNESTCSDSTSYSSFIGVYGDLGPRRRKIITSSSLSTFTNDHKYGETDLAQLFFDQGLSLSFGFNQVINFASNNKAIIIQS